HRAVSSCRPLGIGNPGQSPGHNPDCTFGRETSLRKFDPRLSFWSARGSCYVGVDATRHTAKARLAMPPTDLESSGSSSRIYFSQRLRLHYVDWGNPEAPPLLLVHGGGDPCRNWAWGAHALRDD